MSEPSPQRRYTDVRHTHLSRRASKHARRGLIIGPTTSGQAGRRATLGTALGRAHPALCGVGGGQHPCHLWSTTGLARELVGASCQSGSGGQECCAGHDSIHVVDAAKLSHGGRRVARLDLLGGRRVARSEAVRGADRGAMLRAGRRALSRAELRHATNINRGPRSQTVGWIAPAPAPSSPAATLASA